MSPLLCYYKEPRNLEGTVSSWLKSRVQAALDAGLPPAQLPSAGLKRQTVAMPAGMLARIRTLAEEAGVAPGRMAGMLAEAVDRGTSTELATDSPAAESGDRPEQVRLLAASTPLLDAGRIVLIEAGTGVGKSRLAARIAQHFQRRPDVAGPVVIATPSVAQLSHLAREIQVLREHPSGVGLPLPTVLLGRANFVDLDLALEYAEATGHQSARAWIAEGAPAGLTESTKSLVSIVPGIRGLMEDWLQVLQAQVSSDPDLDLEADDVLLTEDSSEFSQQCYLDLREQARERPLVLCSHAMLASDAIAKRRGQEGVLPRICCLVIDEAHQFEQEVANVASHKVSLWSLSLLLRREKWPALQAGKAARDACVEIDRCIATLSGLPIGNGHSVRITGEHNTGDLHFDEAWAQCSKQLQAAGRALSAVSAKLAKTSLPGWRNAQIQIDRAARAISLSVSGEYAVEVSHSAVRKLSSLSVGPRSVAYLLSPFWESARSAALMSATLYVPTYTGETSFYIAKTLALPPDRTRQIPSEHPAWGTLSPTIMLPDGAELIRALTPPSKDGVSTDSLRDWLMSVGAVVQMVAKSAAGGTLVLMSSYERVNILAGLVPDLVSANRLIVQGPSKGVARCESEFRAMSKAGSRPVWIATGAAWTGLDLRDRDATRGVEDRLCTDLVIPNVPLGLNRGTTHAARTERFLPFEGMSMALLFRQGLGRLIRRPDLEDRRIWVLDGRLLVRSAARSGSLLSPCLMMLDRYRKTQRFRLT